MGEFGRIKPLSGAEDPAFLTLDDEQVLVADVRCETGPELAGAVDTVLRAEDRMYRVGGDEFAAILHDVDAEGAEEIGQRMCEAAESVMGEFEAGLSIGIALPAPYEQASEFLERADQMLYEVKREARGTARVALPEQGVDS